MSKIRRVEHKEWLVPAQKEFKLDRRINTLEAGMNRDKRRVLAIVKASAGYRYRTYQKMGKEELLVQALLRK